MKPAIPFSIWAIGRALGVAIAIIALKPIQAAEKADAEAALREWNEQTATSLMNDRKTLAIVKMSNNEVSGDFGLPQQAALMVRCWEESQLDVAVALDRVVDEDGGLTLRFDQTEPINWPSAKAVGFKALFARSAPELIARMKAAKRVVVGINEWNGPQLVFEFSLNDFSGRVKKVEALCSPKNRDDSALKKNQPKLPKKDQSKLP